MECEPANFKEQLNISSDQPSRSAGSSAVSDAETKWNASPSGVEQVDSDLDQICSGTVYKPALKPVRCGVVWTCPGSRSYVAFTLRPK